MFCSYKLVCFGIIFLALRALIPLAAQDRLKRPVISVRIGKVDMPPTLYLIDGHALAYRAYFALMSGGGSAFVTRSGEPTAGVFGFTSV